MPLINANIWSIWQRGSAWKLQQAILMLWTSFRCETWLSPSLYSIAHIPGEAQVTYIWRSADERRGRCSYFPSILLTRFNKSLSNTYSCDGEDYVNLKFATNLWPSPLDAEETVRSTSESISAHLFWRRINMWSSDYSTVVAESHHLTSVRLKLDGSPFFLF